MARPIDPEEPPIGEPGDPGYVPPTDANTKIAAIVSNSNATFASDQIMAAGGPWTTFKVRVTPMNGNGSGPSAEVTYTLPTPTPPPA